jgi:hypothetical protein
VIDLNPADTRPSGAVGDPERVYWKVGTGLPEMGSCVGYDLTWFDADDAVVSQRLLDAAPKTPITEAEYDVLIAQWEGAP